MGFLFPTFLFAGLALGIPLAIHLFNLRRYKTVFFPHTRFLRAIQLRSRRSSEVRYRLLLAMRMLFLAALVAAFAQPFFRNKNAAADARRLQVIYIDNNPAMSLKKGARTGLDAALDAARTQIAKSPAGARFLLLTNDRPIAYEPLPKEKIVAALSGVSIAPGGKSAPQIFAAIQSLAGAENAGAADVYWYSNFPHGSFPAQPAPADIRGITLHAIAVQQPAQTNVFIDTAYLTTPVLQAGQGNALIVRSRSTSPSLGGGRGEATPVIQLSVNGQVKSAASLRFTTSGTSTDTLSFSVADAGWQRITLSVADVTGIRSDDTFLIAARSAPGLSVLVLNEGQPSPYVLAAFRSYSGFSVRNESISNAPQDWKPYNLIILNGITGLPDAVGKNVQSALEGGRSVCIFPGRTRNLSGINNALHYAADIRVITLDTSVQPATSLQPGADIVKDIFEGIPPNVQLPTATWHYAIGASLGANGQNILSFRNGDPLLACYLPARGALYLCATSADAEGGNFPASYFFVPFLYQMAAQSRGGDVHAITAGSGQSAFLSVQNSDERNMVHLYAPGLDAIPPQRAAGGGVEVFPDAVVGQPGFYKLAASSGDSAVLGLNGTRAYSTLDFWDMAKLRESWPDRAATWQTPETAASAASEVGGEGWPLWKVCAIIALLLAAAETYLIAKGNKESAAATVATA